MSLLFQFEQQYSNLTAEITAKIGQLGKIAGHSDRRDAVRALNTQMEEVSDLVCHYPLCSLPASCLSCGNDEFFVF